MDIKCKHKLTDIVISFRKSYHYRYKKTPNDVWYHVCNLKAKLIAIDPTGAFVFSDGDATVILNQLEMEK